MIAHPPTQRVQYLTGARSVELREVPVLPPAPGGLLLRVGAATTCGTDLKVWQRGGHPRMLTVPCPFGHEMAGTVAAIGDGLDDWRVGERVVVANSASCGSCPSCRAGRENLCRDLAYLNGAFAEYVTVPARFVRRSTYRVPDGLPTERAALAEPLACVLHGLELSHLDGRETALVLGAGPIGLIFVAVLASLGRRVAAADPVPGRLATARRLGASATADPARLPVEIAGLFDGARPDLVVEATGRPEVWETAIAAAAPAGEVLLFGGCAPGTTAACDTHKLHYSELTVRGAYHHRPATFARAVELLAGGLDLGPLLSEERPLDELQAALEAMEARRTLKAVIRP